MKTKSLCMMIIVAMVFTVSVNVFADCGSCEKPKTPCCKKQIKQQIEQKVEVKKEKEDEDIPLSQVPKSIKKAAKEAVKGIKLTEALKRLKSQILKKKKRFIHILRVTFLFSAIRKPTRNTG